MGEGHYRSEMAQAYSCLQAGEWAFQGHFSPGICQYSITGTGRRGGRKVSKCRNQVRAGAAGSDFLSHLIRIY